MSGKQRISAASLLVAAATIAVFAQVRDHEFVGFEDPGYITENSEVSRGLTREGVVWAFTNPIVLPLTWLSHMVDVELYGVDAAGPHALTNVALHLANALLLLYWLQRTTGRLGCSTFVAALFALHPLHVESVAWVSARKDTLSALFLLLMLLAWTRYTERRDRASHALAVTLYVLGLMSKPILVTAPLLLLLLDYWPLGRLQGGVRQSARGLLLEKLPFFALSLAVSCLILWVSRGAENPWVTDPPLPQRLAQAAISLALYLWKAVWPVDLTFVYPTPAQQGLGFWSPRQIAGALLTLATLTAIAVRTRRAMPYLLVGWLWFLIALLPVLQLVPSGLRTMQDRYTYVSLIGIFIAVAFAAAELRARWGWPRWALVGAGGALAAACAALSWIQVGYWRDSDALFDHALATNERNAVVHFAKATALAKRGALAEAEAGMRRALEIHPPYPEAHASLGFILQSRGDSDAAIAQYRRALEARPGYLQAMTSLGNALIARGDVEGGLAELRRAVELDPAQPRARYWLAAALARSGERGEAEQQYREVLRRNAGHHWSALALAALLEESGRLPEAEEQYRRVLELVPDHARALARLAWILGAQSERNRRDGERAVALAERLLALEPDSPVTAYVLAAAYAEVERFDAAVSALSKAVARLPAEEPAATREEFQRCLRLYEAGESYRAAEARKGQAGGEGRASREGS